MNQKTKELYEFGPFSLDVTQHTLERDGQAIHLQPKEFQALVFLLKNHGRLLTKQEFMDELWPDTFVDEGNLPRIISTLRKAMGDDEQVFIETVAKVGYRFKASVNTPSDISDQDCPWVGLPPIDSSHARYFCGREEDVQHLVAKLEATTFLAIVGSSGCGKSSLVRAGLIPALAHGMLPDSPSWLFCILCPGPHPLHELATQLRALCGPESSESAAAILGGLRSDPNALCRIVEAFRKKQRVVWVVDQFEEIVTLCGDEERSQFVDILLNAASDPEQRHFIVTTIRTSFLPRFEAFPSLWRLISEHQYAVLQLSRDKLEDTIVEAANRAGLELEQGLVIQILDDLGDQPGALPLLSHTMRELFKTREGRRLTFRGYQSIGRIQEAIANRADAVLMGFGPSERRLVRRVMLLLTQVGVSPEQDARRRLPFHDLLARPQDTTTIDSVIRRLADARLLTLGLGDAAMTVELSHESLIRHWPLLSSWISEGRRARQVFDVLDAAAKDWSKTHRDQSLLFRGVRLESALKEMPLYEDFLTEVHREFLEASKRLGKREAWLKLLFAGGLAFLFVVLALGLGAWWKWREATHQRDIARSFKLAAESRSQQQFDPELGLLLAIEAVRAGADEQAAILRSALGSFRLKNVLHGHSAQVVSVATNRTGNRLVTASFDRTARVWDLPTGKTIATLTGHAGLVNSAEFSPDGNTVVTASTDGTALLWNANTGENLRALIGHQGRVNNAVFSPDASMIVTAGADMTARVWDSRSGMELRRLVGHEGWLNSAVFDPGQRWIATASKDRIVRVWQVTNGRGAAVLRGHTGSVLNVAFSSDGGLLATASADRTARVWDTGTWKMVCEMTGHAGNVNSAEFNSDGNWIVTASTDGTARLWDAKSCRMLLELRGHRSSVNRAIFGEDGKTIFTASGDQTVRAWSVYSTETRFSIRGHQAPVYAARFSPDGKWVVTASKDGTARIWDAQTGDELRRLQHPAPVLDAIFSPDGALVATGCSDSIVRVWDSRSGRLGDELPGHKGPVHSIVFGRSGTSVVTSSEDKTARIWDLLRKKTVHELSGHRETVTDASFSPDGRWVVTASQDNSIRLWDSATGEVRYEWNVATGFVNSARFSPDGKYIIIACGDQTARLWSLNDRKVVGVLRGHDNWVNYAEFNSDGSLVATASGDQTARIWEAGSGQILLEILGNHSSLMSISFSPDGRALATAAIDGTVRVESCKICGGSVGELLTLAEARRTRQLTPQEAERYLGIRK